MFSNYNVIRGAVCLLCVLLIFYGRNAFAAYDLPYIGAMQTHVAAYEDTLVDLARDNKLGFVELRAANPGVDPWLPGEGTEIVLPFMNILPDAPRDGIVINLPEMRLYVFDKGDKEPLTYPIGVGRDGLSTPMGTTKVISKKIGPIWRPTKRMREEDPELPELVRPGSDNPLGTHALYLGWPEYAIHGTNRPYGIGRRVSSGCIRLYPEDIVELFDKVPEGTNVRVVDQPVKAAWIDGGLYIEAHPSLTQADHVEQQGGVPEYEITQKDMALIMKRAGDRADEIDWLHVKDIVRSRRGVPEIIIAPEAKNNDESDKDQIVVPVDTEKTAQNDVQSLDVNE